MSDHVYKSVDLTGTSPKGVQDAIENAIRRASKTVRNMRWFEITQVRGAVENGEVAHWQVQMRIGFTLEE